MCLRIRTPLLLPRIISYVARRKLSRLFALCQYQAEKAMHIYPDPLRLRREHREMDTNVVNLATRRRSHPYSSPFPPPKTTSPSTAMAKFHTFMCPHPSSPLFCCLGCRLKPSQDIEFERNKKKLRCKWSFQYSTTQLPPKGFRQFCILQNDTDNSTVCLKAIHTIPHGS